MLFSVCHIVMCLYRSLHSLASSPLTSCYTLISRHSLSPGIISFSPINYTITSLSFYIPLTNIYLPTLSSITIYTNWHRNIIINRSHILSLLALTPFYASSLLSYVCVSNFTLTAGQLLSFINCYFSIVNRVFNLCCSLWCLTLNQ